jgi:hypothetical protein
MTDFRATQIVAEVWARSAPAVQATNINAEVWGRPAPAMQASDILAEVWAPNSTVGTRFQVSTILAEVWVPIVHFTQPPLLIIIT